MYGYQLIASLTEDHGHRPEVAVSGPHAGSMIIGSLADFVTLIAELGDNARRTRMEVVVDHTVHQDATGDDWIQLANVEYLTSTHGESLTWRSCGLARTLAVAVFDGDVFGGNGLSIEVPDALAVDIETLFTEHYIDDSDARRAVEAELITCNWDSWIRSELRLPDRVEEQWQRLTPTQERAVFDRALARLVDEHDWSPEFESRGDQLIIDMRLLTATITTILSTADCDYL
ncbi:hypothetical protein IU510_20610 [Nocardia cyriacigeorgica]|uniref:hypothetical protein n=1 Tax=Nocardia cyriacigeorgica TaxID=135487 RepID=UPI001894697A|nr:hypothetical protein [Nocardia cyriacigeorgica]MBF6100464.1 hypothetical protein [Nocardia cyriacigeorgica]MBF6320298.1 hypothetical protein [Nocardia cyriacigeorgica]MBF6346326.1 hypothetical protein [Nocardia cyriacigeorgica]MBF6534216.1 hypothetical protein [Nocardia cyriacigeorgica]